MIGKRSEAVLLYHTGALGDFITTLPALDYWKKHNPESRLVMLGNPQTGKLAFDIGLVQEYLDVNQARFSGLFSEILNAGSSCFLASFSQAIVFANADSLLLANLRACRVYTLSHPPFPTSHEHVADYHLSLFTDVATLSDNKKMPHVSIASLVCAGACKESLLEQGFIAIHPGSGSSKKNWPFERFIEVADYFRSKGAKIAWIKGPAEEGWNFPKEDPCIDNVDSTMLSRLLSRCEMFIGNDSGVTHLAAALGRKTAAVFGPSDPHVWAPRGKNVQVIYKKKQCSPCHLSMQYTCNENRHCLMHIGVSDVLDACQSLYIPE